MPKRLTDLSPSPIVNNRFRRWANNHISWGQILITCGYAIVERRTLRSTHKGMAARSGGDEYYVHCIYHPEKTASLHMMPYGFHCFGCGETGDKVKFTIDAQRIRTNRVARQFFTAASKVCKE